MIPDDESMIRTEPRRPLPPTDRQLERELNALPFRPIGYEW